MFLQTQWTFSVRTAHYRKSVISLNLDEFHVRDKINEDIPGIISKTKVRPTSSKSNATYSY